MPEVVLLTPAEIIPIIAPDYAGVDMSGYINLAELQIACGKCPKLRPQMVANLSVHMAILAGRSEGATGEIESYRLGGAAIKYSSTGTQSSVPGLSDTSYGKEYDRLRRICNFTPMTSGSEINAQRYLRQRYGVFPC